MRGRSGHLYLQEEGELVLSISDRSGGSNSNTCRKKGRESVGSERTERVAHAVTTSSAKPILLETAARAKSGIQRRLANKCKRHKRMESQGIIPGSCSKLL